MKHHCCIALVLLLAGVQSSLAQASKQGAPAPAPAAPRLTTLPPPPPFGTPSLVNPLITYSDIMYEMLHDPWFSRAPWGSRTSEQVPKNARRKFESGYRHWDSRHWAKAEKALKEATRVYPEFVRAWDYLGRTLRSQGRFDEARTAFEKASTIDPEYLPARTGLLEVANSRGENAVDFANVCWESEKNATGQIMVKQLAGSDTVQLREPSAAFRHFVQVERARMLAAVGRAHLLSGDRGKAAVAAREAYLLDPYSLKIAMLVTDILVADGEQQQAETVLQRYIKTHVPKQDKQHARERLKSLSSQAN